MPKFYRYLFLLFAVCASCNKANDSAPAPTPPTPTPPTTIPAGSRRISLTVDPQYDLRAARGYSLLDSVAMQTTAPTVLAPTDYESAVFFVDQPSGNIVAVVRTPLNSSNVVVNAASVADALLTLVPAYRALPADLEQRCRKEAPSSKPFQGLIGLVDALLKAKKPIYAANPDFVAQILELNKYIATTYLNSPKLEGGRLTQESDGLRTTSEKDFTKWLDRAGKGTLYNRVHSYVYVEFAPLGGGAPVTTVLDALAIKDAESATALSTLNLPDNYYSVQINQTNKLAKNKNELAIASKFVGAFLGLLFGVIEGQSRNDCVGSITGTIASDLSALVVGSPNSSPKDMLLALGETAKKGIIAGFTSSSCVRYALSKQMITKVVADQLNAYSKIVTGVSFAYDILEIAPYVQAFREPVNLAQNVQLHEGEVKEGWLSVAKDGTLKDSYGPGEKIYPGLKLLPNGQYGDLSKANFKVSWKVATANGTTNLSQTSTASDGKTTVEWTLPKDKSGVVTLLAELKDKEGDHLQGSPLEFKVTVNDSIAYYTALLKGKWSLNFTGSPTKQFFEFNSDKSLLQTGGVDGSGVSYTSYECTSKNSTWSVFKSANGYSVQLNKPYESRYYYAYIRANNKGNLTFYNAFNTCSGGCIPPKPCW